MLCRRAPSAANPAFSAFLLMVLCCGAAPVDAADRIEAFGTFGYSGLSGASLTTPRGPTLQAGVGYELRRSTSLELMAGYHLLGDAHYSYLSGVSGASNVDSRVGLIPVSLNVTKMFETQFPYPYVTLGTGLYALLYDRIRSGVANDLSWLGGINGGFGFKGTPGMLAVRLDVRAHVVSVESLEQRYDLARNDAWMKMFVFGFGIQFP